MRGFLRSGNGRKNGNTPLRGQGGKAMVNHSNSNVFHGFSRQIVAHYTHAVLLCKIKLHTLS